MSSADEPKGLQLPLFRTGQVVGTPGVLRLLDQAGVNPMNLLVRHVLGDDGDLCDEDRDANRKAIALGGRVFSSYEVGTGPNATKVWIITEADRSSTTLLLPEEY
jgi:hypothetical protein